MKTGQSFVFDHRKECIVDISELNEKKYWIRLYDIVYVEQMIDKGEYLRIAYGHEDQLILAQSEQRSTIPRWEITGEPLDIRVKQFCICFRKHDKGIYTIAIDSPSVTKTFKDTYKEYPTVYTIEKG